MIISAIQNIGTQQCPRVTQHFGERPEYYKKYGLKGHNGNDIGPAIRNSPAEDMRTIFAPFTGEAKTFDTGKIGYGKHIKIRNGELEVTLGHLAEVYIADGQKVYQGDKIGLMGSTGDSTAMHLHITLKRTEQEGKLWSRAVLDRNNGFGGAIDAEPFMLTWKGTFTKPSL